MKIAGKLIAIGSKGNAVNRLPLTCFAISLPLLLPGTAQADEAVTRPNIVLIVADDLGWSDLACYGSDLHETPHLDGLAKQGVRFTDAYSASPVCSPTRASLLTGKHPARLAITIWREGSLTPPTDRKLLPATSVPDLPHQEVTLASSLQSAGYRTALIGKWHLGDADHSPETHGFDVNIGGTHWGAPATYFFPYRGLFGSAKERRYVPHLEYGQPGEYLTDRLTDEAIRFIDHAKDAPFFLYLAHHAPHTPIEGKPDLVEKYKSKITPTSRHQNPGYAAMIQSLDESVGRIAQRLDELGLADRTLLLFTSDNGGQIGTYDGKNVTNNAPLRSGKGSLYEGGVRIPLIVRWPGTSEVGTSCREPILSTDIYHTLMAAAGIEAVPLADGSADGLSLVPLLKDSTSRLDREDLFFHYPHYYPTTTPVSAVRSRDWKLLEYQEDDHVELYHLSDDLSEATDLASAEPEQAKVLLDKLRAWRHEVQARMPSPNPAYKEKKKR